MSKLFNVFLIAACLYCINANPAPKVDEVEAEPAVDTAPVHPNLLNDNIKNPDPKDGNPETEFHSVSVSKFSSEQTVNGVPVKKESGGHIMTNDNGKIHETFVHN